MMRVTPEPFEPETELAAFRATHRQAGAVASFVGCVRGRDADALVLEHYPALTEQVIDQFVAEARARFALEGVLVRHRVGRMTGGEPIVLVACASAHRKQALAGVDFLMDKLKTEAPFWKREENNGESRWIEPRPEDYQAGRGWAEHKGQST